ncbi:MAG TPA: chromosome partitioning protein [Sutterella sp.]|nr:chromosome partitioning protein [Sutterella sp.]
MALIFCVANQKGGVGKTTTAVNMAAVLAENNQRVLLVDLDPQGNATSASGFVKDNITETLYPLLFGETTFEKVCVKSEAGGYDLLPSNRDLAGAEIELYELEDRDQRLSAILSAVDKRYDYILIDCPPSLSLLTTNAFCCAKGVIIPMQCEYFAMEGVSDLVHSIERIREGKNPNLSFLWLLRVMFDPRTSLQQQVSDQLDEFFGENVFSTVIPRNVRLAEASSYLMPGVVYDKSSKGAKAYRAFGQEFLRRMKKFKRKVKGN